MVGGGLTQQRIRQGIETAKTERRQVILRDSRTKGLQLVISAKGTATWSLLFTPKGGEKTEAGYGKRKRIMLGKDRAGYGLTQARLDAGVLRQRIAVGEDPTIERDREREEQAAKLAKLRSEEKKRKEVEARQITVERLAELYFAARSTDSGIEKNRRTIEFSVLPVIGSKSLNELDTASVQLVIDTVRARGRSTQCHRVHGSLRTMLRWALRRKYLRPDQSDIWKDLDLPPKSKPRERVLDAREIRWLWQQCERWDSNPDDAQHHLGPIVRLDILLGQRSCETCAIEKEELGEGLRVWTIPRERTKNKKAHSVPLPPLARSIIGLAMQEASDHRLFVGSRGATIRPDKIAHSLDDAIRNWNEDNSDNQIESFIIHDLRRTVATRLEEIGVTSNTIETLLNHISGKAGSVTRLHYAHGDQSIAIRRALTRWQGIVEQCIQGHDPFAIDADYLDALEAAELAKFNEGKANLRIAS